jgi:hypothetical protein
MKKILQDVEGKAEASPVGGYIWDFKAPETTT